MLRLITGLALLDNGNITFDQGFCKVGGIIEKPAFYPDFSGRENLEYYCILYYYVPPVIAGTLSSIWPNTYSILQRFDIIKNIRMAAYIRDAGAADIVLMIVAALAYIIIFSFAGFVKIKRSDLK